MAATRQARAVWNGDLAKGSGEVSAISSGKFSALGVSWGARTESPQGKTSPEELLAAAHAGCYAMGLASELTKRGAPPQLLEVRCRVTMDEVEGKGHQIVHSTIDAVARVDGIDQAGFEAAVQVADEECPFSELIKAGAGVTVNAKLEGGSNGS